MSVRPSQIFIQWIEAVIADPSAGECLPTISELAQRFGLSPTSIKHLLKPYITRNMLTAIRGKGTYITSRMSPSKQPITLRTLVSADSIANALTDDIATGKLKQGDPLPAVKFLCKQFRVGQSTVTQAYRRVAEKGLARKVGRNYWVGGLQSIRSFRARKTIACFNFSEGDASDLTSANDIYKAFAAMEYELQNFRLDLHFEDGAQCDRSLHPRFFSQSDCAGVIITGVRVARFALLQPRIQKLVPVLPRTGKRILVCGADPECSIPKQVSYFCHGTIITNTVRTAAEYCFTKDFKDISLLFREKEDNFRDLRFLIRFISESRMRNPKVRFHFLIQTLRLESSPENIFQRASSYKRSGSFDYLEGLLSKYEKMTMDDLYRMITISVNLDDLLTRVPQGAIWVTKDASTALQVVEWCTSHHIRIPSSAAILTFDQSQLLQYRGIATCVPDWHTMGYLMAHALIGDIPMKKSRRGFLRTPAILYNRATLP